MRKKKWSEKHNSWITETRFSFIMIHSLMRGYPCKYYKLDKWISVFGIQLKIFKV